MCFFMRHILSVSRYQCVDYLVYLFTVINHGSENCFSSASSRGLMLSPVSHGSCVPSVINKFLINIFYLIFLFFINKLFFH